MDKLIGFLIPPVIDLINRKVKGKVARFWVSVVLCGVAATVFHYFKHNGIVGAEELANDIMYMFATAQISYQAVWSNPSMLGEIRDELRLNAKLQ